MAERKRKPVADRFWSKVAIGQPDDCWLWKAQRMPRTPRGGGYGVFHFGGGLGQTTAHRAAYILTHGAPAPGMVVCHRCDNPPCVNPRHLFLGTPRENSADMVSKGRQKPSGLRGGDHPAAKVSPRHAQEISDLRAAGLPVRQIAALFGLSLAHTYRITKGQHWSLQGAFNV